MVDVKVEIAWNAGFLTAAASRTWTDVSTYVELDQGLTITVGRGDERSEADANHLTLTLDNSDGRFTPGKTGGAYYPNVLLNRPIRVTGTPVDGAAQVEFLGFIDEWPIEWSDGTERSAYVTVSASSRLSRLGTQTQLKSIVELAILPDSPTAYYMLAEPGGATQANDSSGNRAAALTLTGDGSLPMVFGTATGPGTDDLTAAQFVGGQYLSMNPGLAPPGAAWIECFFNTSGVSQGLMSLAYSGAPQASFILQIDASGKVFGGASSSALGVFRNATSPLTYNDGNTHHALYAITAAGISELYVDGALVA
jgi:hypothetical protein